MNGLVGEGFMLGFNFECDENEILTQENIRRVFMKAERLIGNLKGQFAFEISHFVELLDFIKGKFNVVQNNKQLQIKIEILFSTKDPSKLITRIPIIEIFPRINVNNNTVRWVKEISMKDNTPKYNTGKGGLVRGANRKLSSQLIISGTRAKELEQVRLRLLNKMRGNHRESLKINELSYNDSTPKSQYNKQLSTNLVQFIKK